MSVRTLVRAGATASVCAVIGAGVGIASSAASPRHASTHTTTTSANSAPWGPAGGFFLGGFPVHADQVILDKAGTGYITQTVDDGTLSSVSSDQLSVTEAIKSVAYKTVTLTIPTGATIALDGNTASVSDLRSGDFVLVRQSADGTSVSAQTSSEHGGLTSRGGWDGGDSGWRSNGFNTGFPPFFGGR
jgi:hypothetical protein